MHGAQATLCVRPHGELIAFQIPAVQVRLISKIALLLVIIRGVTAGVRIQDIFMSKNLLKSEETLI